MSACSLTARCQHRPVWSPGTPPDRGSILIKLAFLTDTTDDVSRENSRAQMFTVLRFSLRIFHQALFLASCAVAKDPSAWSLIGLESSLGELQQSPAAQASGALTRSQWRQRLFQELRETTYHWAGLWCLLWNFRATLPLRLPLAERRADFPALGHGQEMRSGTKP